MKFSVQRLATATGFSAGEIKYLFNIPINSVCKAKTFEKACKALQDAKAGSDTELAAYKKVVELLPKKLTKIKTAQKAEALYREIEDYEYTEIIIPTAKHWLTLTKTLNQTVAIAVVGIPDAELVKNIITKMTVQLKTTSKETIRIALASLKNDGFLEMGVMLASKEIKQFLTALAEFYIVKEVAST